MKSRFLVLCAIVCVMAQMGDANVVLLGNNLTLSFADIEASFSPGVKGSGVNGIVYASEPLNACSPLTIKAVKGPPSPFALIVRGGCTFDEKVKNAQDAGFKAAIVYDNENSGVLVSMAGSSSGIHIYAVFVSKASGEVLKKSSGHTDVEVWILPTFDNSAWSIMAISFISLLAMSAVLATCFFVRRHRIRRDHPRIPEAREFHGMSSQLVKAMPSLIFTKVQEDNCTSSMCAICLEDYSVGEKLRVLPCRHKFHAACVDLWLTSWRTFCPVCKRDATSGVSELPATEATPLLSSAVRLPSQPSSFRSSVAASPPRPISRHPSSHSVSRAYSVSSTPHSPNPFRSHTNLPGVIHASRSTTDLANMSSPHPRISHLSSSTHSLVGSHLSPPISIRYPLPHSRHESPSPHVSSPYISNSGYGSSSYYYLGGSSQHGSYLRRCGESGPSLSTMVPRSSQQQFQSEANVAAGASSAQSSRQSYLRRCGDSDASLSDMASAQSLPGC
ncbi:RING finger protein 13 isoform X1 [Zea mays]|uniref:RING finger protein 13 n=2 Tax=Zea mays TaxID=4577 RepID=B4FXY0_MAIZE|nr:RING finger protein 13 precursor 1 precursor [Zea mays]NP_001398751.1 RING finger protein 13 precursor 1 precursor [Zea mays]NP_001398752.1 RING finger protein 13 precursor 1 precursor [Zea mays]XP_008674970.1 RING finger protein 13 isoform X1 [Zea mays]XP_008674977.1 RING finger protein 13 isoform X1 [Zea mays]ACF86973.1 unknown [Zea mays]ACG29236.1 RING finger protein 13 [Zea mays]ACN25513.1 unknown [Zea mays]ACN28650.1 unknown [Zea mays]ONM02067.1 Receptor homology region transmembra|eukprot:NP_001147957.1 RING finger protein 13 precursor [Zea mays]